MSKIIFIPSFVRICFITCITIFLFHTDVKSQSTKTVLSCINVLPNGDNYLSWNKPADACNSFHGYYIYGSSNKNGPYIVVDSVLNLSQTFYTHTGTVSGSNIWYYYLVSKYDCGGLSYPPTDTLASMKLDVINTNNGIAQLSWNKPRTPLLPSSGGFFYVYKEYPAGNWRLIDSTTNNKYIDTIFSICNNTQINYKIVLKDSSSCISSSSVFGGSFKDVTSPEIPDIDTVSVITASGYACIGWNKVRAKDTKAYVLYSFKNGSWTPIDTVMGLSTTFYTALNSDYDAKSGFLQYKLAAFDSCGNLSPAILSFNTMFLNATFDLCSRTASLSWNQYNNMPGGVTSYTIYYSENGGPYQVAGSTQSTTFIHQNLKAGINYCYFVRAADPTGLKTSSSSTVCVYNNGIKPPAFIYLKTASVIAHNLVKIDFYIDTAAAAKGYRVSRAEAKAGPYSEIAIIPPGKIPNLSYIDNGVSTNKKNYYYRVSAIDSCGYNLIYSDTAKLIVISGTANEDFSNQLSWSDYENWMGGVNSYNLYKAVDGIWDLNPIASIPYGQNSYLDVIVNELSGQGSFCYKVEAIEGSGNIYLFNENSFSDSVCVNQKPKLFLPNAFSPSGVNKIFLPVSTFASLSNFEFIIYTSWGAPVFQSSDPKKGWDGTQGGKNAPEGVYPYQVKMQGSNGKYLEKWGTVTLIR